MSAEAKVPKIKIEDAGVSIDHYLVKDTDRHGNDRYYFRRKGQPKVRLRALLGSEEFLQEFRKAYGGPGKPEQKTVAARPATLADIRKSALHGSLAWLFNEYERRSKKFLEMDESTKTRRRRVMDEICAERSSEDDSTAIGTKPFRPMRLRVLNVICNRCPTPDTANARVKALRRAMEFATEEEWLEFNPARDLKYRKSSSTGYHTWEVPEVEQYEARWSVGTIQRLALAVLLYTGDRSSDAVVLGKQHRKDVTISDNGAPRKIAGWQFTQFKGRNKSPTTLWLPALPQLLDIIAQTPSKGLTYLETSFGKPFTRKGFGTQFKRWCKAAGLPHCSAHGVRKAGATVAAERGATPYQLMAIFGWKTLTQALGYTKAAEQKKLAAAAMHMLALRDQSVPPLSQAVSHQ